MRSRQLSLSALNALGVVTGKITQNILSGTKVLGIAAIVLAGVGFSIAKPPILPPSTVPATAMMSIPLALVFVLYAFGGWAHAAYVAAEVRDQNKNIPRALALGIAGITLTYLIVNATYVYVLDFDVARRTSTPAADVIDHVFGPWGSSAVSKLVMLSALGAINGMILTGTANLRCLGGRLSFAQLALKMESTKSRTSCGHRDPGTCRGLPYLARWILRWSASVQFDAFLRWTSARGLGTVQWWLRDSRRRFRSALLVTHINDHCVSFRPPLQGHGDRTALHDPAISCSRSSVCATCLYMLHASLVYAQWLSLIGFLPAAVGLVAWLALSRQQIGS